MKTAPLIILTILFTLVGTLKSDELATLQANFKAAKERATGPIEDRYHKELESLKKKAMARGDLELANRVDAVARFSEFSGLWLVSGKNGAPREIQFLADGEGTSSYDHANGKKHAVKWLVYDDQVIVLRGADSLTLRISGKGGEFLEGRGWDGSPLKMKRSR